MRYHHLTHTQTRPLLPIELTVGGTGGGDTFRIVWTTEDEDTVKPVLMITVLIGIRQN